MATATINPNVKCACGDCKEIGKVRYVRIAPPSDGWVYGKLVSGHNSKGGDTISLCEYTKVEILETKKVNTPKGEECRTFFQVLDGNSEGVGKTLSMTEAHAKQHLLNAKRKYEKIKIGVLDLNWKEKVYSVQRHDQVLFQCAGEIHYAGLTIPVTLTSREDGQPQLYEPLSPGTYNLMAPDFPHPHQYSVAYRQEKRGQFDLAWFHIEDLKHPKEHRYLHMGHFSEGCVSITHIKDWESLYHKIICYRSDGNAEAKTGGGHYIGTIEVSKNAAQVPTNSQPHRLSSF